MISEAVQTALEGVITNTFQNIADDNVALPYCIHEESGAPEFLKEGISGYVWTVEAAIIAKTPDAAEDLAESAITAMASLSGAASVEFTGISGGYDQQSNTYIKILTFSVITNS